MKVYLSNYRYHWFSPYKILEKVLFWKDWDNIDYDTPWVEKWTDRITPFSQAIQKFLDFIHPRIEYVKIDRYDTWNMDSTLSPIILPMLKQLKETKRGSGYVDEEDLPVHMRHGDPDGYDNWVHHKWDWVLDEMIWAFEQLNNPDWEDKFIHGEPSYEENEEEHPDYGEVYSLKQTNPDYWVDYEGIKKYNDRIMNGTRLFGKYYQNLWD